ncbi:MAG: phosphate signaling complex protein PhoU [Firmicutes bacterium]|jgi:phosphate transport system protein|nr:phosphate signaling complex protein PhoU [Bacillota bacterium]
MNEGRCCHQLEIIHDDILRMGTLVEEAIRDADRALSEQDLELAKSVIEGDKAIDNLERSIESDCIRILALHHPLASDLRTVTTALKVITDLERMADHATAIALIALRIGANPLIKPLVDIPRMSTLARQMVHESLDAFVSRNTELAQKVRSEDDLIDRLYSELHDELLGLIIQGTNTANAEQALNLLFVAQHLERIADHATNIAERVIYLVTGERVSS